jgi:hypothetical protein
MRRQTNRSWTEAELSELFTTYFGDRMSVGQLERLVADVSASIADKHARSVAASDSEGEPA